MAEEDGGDSDCSRFHHLWPSDCGCGQGGGGVPSHPIPCGVWGSSLPPHPLVSTNKIKSLSRVILICFVFYKHTICLSLNITHRNLSRVSGTYSDVSFINLVEKGSHKRIFPITETYPFNLHRLGWKHFLNAHTLSLPSSLNSDQIPCSPSRFLGVRII